MGILGKSKRMLVLEQVGLTETQEMSSASSTIQTRPTSPSPPLPSPSSPSPPSTETPSSPRSTQTLLPRLSPIQMLPRAASEEDGYKLWCFYKTKLTQINVPYIIKVSYIEDSNHQAY